MTISYSVHENHLSVKGDEYRAIVQYGGSVELEGVIDRMIDRGSTITRADVKAVLQEYYGAIESLVLEGFRVNTPSAIYGASIKGNFESPTAGFDASRHSVEPSVSPGVQFRRAVRERAQVQKEEATKPRPNLVEFVDTNSGSRNSALTPGGMAQLVGHRLKFDPADPEQGIFFMALGNGGTPVRVEVVGKNTPGELMFLAPAALTSGSYSVMVRALFGVGDVRTGTLETVLAVN